MNKFMGKIFLFFILIAFAVPVFGQSKSSTVEKFLKGNISEKTAAVRESSGTDAVWLSNKAISFVLESKSILGNDRELDGLCVAAILAYPLDYVRTTTDQNRDIVLKNFVTLFEAFKDSATVQIAIITKVSSMRAFMNISPFIKSLNKYISSTQISDMEVVKSILSIFSVSGDSELFRICYNMLASGKYSQISNELSDAIVLLIPNAMHEALYIANSQSLETVIAFFNLVDEKKSKIPENSFSEISENVLANTILLTGNSVANSVDEITKIQLRALKVLNDNKWTRASLNVLLFFDYAKKLYDSNKMKESDFIFVVESLYNVASFGAVSPLIKCLESFNDKMEKNERVSEKAVIAVIKTLGAIGDKNAFDCILSVTYHDYSKNVLSVAREALSGLKW